MFYNDDHQDHQHNKKMSATIEKITPEILKFYAYLKKQIPQSLIDKINTTPASVQNINIAIVLHAANGITRELQNFIKHKSDYDIYMTEKKQNE